MAFTDYDLSAANNTSIAGIDIGENCPRANINNALRQIMADAKAFTAGGTALTVTRGTLVSNAETTEVLEILAPTGAQTESGGTSDAVKGQIRTTTGLFTNGPTGHANYYDNVISLGWNFPASGAPGGTPENPVMPTCRIGIETKFAQGGASDPFVSEWHLASLFPASAPSNEFRAISAVIPHDTTKWEAHSSTYFRGGQHGFFDGLGNQVIDLNFITSASPLVNVNRSCTFYYSVNNVAHQQQLNAAGNAYLALPHINTRNEIQHSQPTYIVASSAVNAFGTTTVLTLLDSAPVANGIQIYSTIGSAVTGDYTTIRQDANASGNVKALFQNQHASGGTVFNISSSGTTQLQVNGTKIAGARKTGWTTVPTGTATRTTFDTATVTLSQLAERVKALIDDLHATAGHGMIGA